MRIVLFFLIMTSFLSILSASSFAENHKGIVILEYTRIGEDTYSNTNLSLENFRDHMRELKNGPYTVISLPDALKAIETDQKLPEYAIVITFDGGYKASLENALPVLDDANFPFTVFFAPENASLNAQAFLNWKELKRLSRQKGVALGIHSNTFTRISDLPKGQIRANINNAKAAYRKNIGETPQYFAYPFGEYSKTYRDVIEQSGFEAALTLNSGATHTKTKLYEVPRFAMSESFGNIDRFRMVTRTLPLVVTDFEPDNPRLSDTTPVIGFNVTDPNIDLDKMNCFMTGIGRVDFKTPGANRVELRPNEPLNETRTRLNCTYPVQQENAADDQRWQWFGVLLTLKDN